jgi:hypothetical protein
MRVGLHEECLSSLSKFERDVLRQYVAVNIPSRILKKIRLVEKNVVPSGRKEGRKDGRTDRHDEDSSYQSALQKRLKN